MLPSDNTHSHIGYVTKMYPRFSETFIVNELLALERTGLDIDIFSLRPPSDGHFHETLSQVRASVTYLSTHVRAQGLWERLREAQPALPELRRRLPDLLELEADDAVSAIELAMLIRERGITRLHAHIGSVATAVARAAASISGIEYSFTAHAKDIFHESVEPDALRQRIADACRVVTVSDYNVAARPPISCRATTPQRSGRSCAGGEASPRHTACWRTGPRPWVGCSAEPANG